MAATKRHLFTPNSFTESEIETIKKVNNPDVISVIRNEWLNNLKPGVIDNYVDDIILVIRPKQNIHKYT